MVPINGDGDASDWSRAPTYAEHGAHGSLGNTRPLGPWGQIRLLTWKNFTLQRRRPIGTCCELSIPVVFTLALWAIRAYATSVDFGPQSFPDVRVSAFDSGPVDGVLFNRDQNLPGSSKNTNSYAEWAGNFATGIVKVADGSDRLKGGGSSEDFYNCTGRVIAYAPDNEMTRAVMARVEAETRALRQGRWGGCSPAVEIPFVNVSDPRLIPSAFAADGQHVIAAVVFTSGADGLPRRPNDSASASASVDNLALAYTLRMLPDIVGSWETEHNFPEFGQRGPLPAESIPYFKDGVEFLELQAMIDRALATEYHPEHQTPRTVPRLKPFPFPAYTDDGFIGAIQGFFPFIMVISFLYSVSAIVRALVHEKELRIKEAMKMIGLAGWVNWAAWFVKNFLFLMISISAIIIIFNVGGLMPATSVGVLLLFLVAYVIALIGYCFMMSTFFSSSTVAAISSWILFFALYLPYMFVGPTQYVAMTLTEKRLLCLSIPSCMGVCARILAQFEARGVGLHADNLFDDPADDDSFSMGDAIGMLLLDAVICFLVTFYVEAVFPGEFGIPRKWNFFLEPVFALLRLRKTGGYAPLDTGTIDDDGVLNPTTGNADLHAEEPLPQGHSPGVQLIALRKVWSTPTGEKVAVKDVTLTMLESQVTCLLGQNGAGKTTSMSILVGLYPPTSGSVVIGGHDVVDDTANARMSLGLCPQFDILFPTLTVNEHLFFISRLKGVTDSSAFQQQADELLRDVDLVDKGGSWAKTLSGGQKRALSVALAFVGGSKTVILDEPTSGMDPYKRRRVWDLIAKHKAGRTILLTTHYLDEADLLGDRVAIMRDGSLRCVGSPLFLTERFGCGYRLVLVKAPGCVEAVITAVVQRHVQDALLGSDIGDEITYHLPKAAAPRFSQLFAEIEGNLATLRVESMHVAHSNMEDVFMKIHSDADANELDFPGGLDKATALSSCPGCGLDMVAGTAFCPHCGLQQIITTVHPVPTATAQRAAAGRLESGAGGNSVRTRTGAGLMMSQMWGMLYKRALHFKRNKRALIAQVLVPSLFVVCALLIQKYSNDSLDTAAVCREFSTQSYKDNIIYSSINDTGRLDANAAAPIVALRELQQRAEDFVTLSPLAANARIVDISGQNMTQRLVDDAADYTTNLFFRKHVVGFSFSAGAFAIDTDCSVLGQPQQSSSNVHELRLAPGSPYTIQASSAHGNEESFEVTGVAWPVPCPNCQIGSGPCISNSNTSQQWTQCRGFDNDSMWECPAGYHRCTNPTGQSFADCGKELLQCQRVPALAARFNVTCHSPQEPPAGGTIQVSYATPAETQGQGGLLSQTSTVVATGWYNGQSLHAAPEALSFVNNLIASQHLNRSVSITTSNCPLPRNSAAQAVSGFLGATGLCFVLLFALCFLLSSFTLVPVKERTSHAKHIQLVSGANVWMYWVSSFLWDFATTLVLICLIVGIFAAFDIEGYRGANLGYVFLVLALMAWAAIPATYCLSFLFDKPSVAYASVVSIYFASTIVMMITVLILPFINDQQYYKDGTYDQIVEGFYVSPVFTAIQAIEDIYRNHYFLGFCDQTPLNKNVCDALHWYPRSNYLARDGFGIGTPCIVLFIEGWGYFLLLFAMEAVVARGVSLNFWSTVKPPPTDEEADVVAERRRVEASGAGGANGDTVVVHGLTKKFGLGCIRPRKVAVNNLTFGIPSGQCFGLLGVNGAGKTSTFRMLTGELGMGAGSAVVNGHDVATRLRQARRSMGYCPQYDGLVVELTGRETIRMFCMLRGIPADHREAEVSRLLTMFDLDDHSDRLAGTYSGGNKRKLSTAIAMVGDPDVVFLDEPTTGMDPGARRFLWRALTAAVAQGKTIVLTSHSMEECEALCNRVGIMVNGRFKCLGSTQHLKAKFGVGFQLVGKLVPGATADRLVQYVGACLGLPAGAITTVESAVLQQAVLKIDGNARISSLFHCMEAAAAKSMLESYSISQPTLEHIFLSFAKDQHEDDEAPQH